MIVDYNKAAKLNIQPVARPSQVWVKSTWSATWTLRDDLIPLETVWSAAPAIPTATLRHYYGRVTQPGQSAPSVVPRVAGLVGYFILIQHLTEELIPQWWLGYVDKIVDNPEHERSLASPATGEELITCFGMAKALENQIEKCLAIGNDNAEIETVLPLEFNFSGKQNKFSGKLRFAKEIEKNAEFWTSRSIVQYLCKIAPRPNGTTDTFWKLDPDKVVPDDDRPKIRAESRSFADVLGEVLSPSRLLGYDVRFIVNKTGANTVDVTNLVIHPFTMADAKITLPSGAVIEKNSRQHIVFADADPLTQARFSDVGFVNYDRVKVIGGNLVIVVPMSYTNGRLEENWTSKEQTEYNEAASTQITYVPLEADEQKRENLKVRETLPQVFRRFKWHEDLVIEYKDPVQPEDADPINACPLLCRVLDQLPMYAEVDYAIAPKSRDDQVTAGLETPIDETLGRKFLRPYCYVKHGTEFLAGDTLAKHHSTLFGDNGNLPKFHVNVQPDPNRILFNLDVAGADQQVIAGSQFSPLPVDDVYDRVDWKEFEVVVAIEVDRKLTVIIEGEAAKDFDRTKVIYAGNQYFATWLEPSTEIKAPGRERKTAVGGWIRDDSWRLRDIAELAATWYCKDRKTVQIQSARITGLLQIGDLVLKASGVGGPRDVFAPVTEIAITTAIGNPENPPEISQKIVTWIGEIDPLDAVGGSDE